jgi:hypothetical protein
LNGERGGGGSRADGGGGGEWNANTRFLVRCFEKMLGTPKKDMNTIKYTLRIKRLISERRVVMLGISDSQLQSGPHLYQFQTKILSWVTTHLYQL